MEFSLDNPGFSNSVTSVQDAPKSSGSSSASSGQPQRSCAKCPSRMSSIDRHKHLICMRCRGYECLVDLRCEECEGWSKEEMLVHEKFSKSLASKSKGRGKSSTKVTKKPASPLSTSANVDLDNRFAAQYDSMIKEMDDRMELLSSSLLHQIRSLFDNPQSNNPYSEDASAFPGQAGVQTVPEPPQPHDKSASVRSRKRLVCEGGTGAQASGLAQAQGSNVKNLPKSKIAQPPGFQDVPSGSGGPRGRREHRFDEDDYVDDKDSLAEAPLDRAFARLVYYIYERFLHSEPQTEASSAPRCEYESYFSVADPPEPSRKFMRLYPRVSEIQVASSEHAANLSLESRPLFRILPVRRRAFSIGDDTDFCRQRFLNSDFSRICRSKSVPKSRMA